jgi:adenosylcobinamide-GDP ribazoletransferase
VSPRGVAGDPPGSASVGAWLAAPRTALGFLTRLPTGGARFAPAELSRAALFFPAIGLIVGGTAAGVRALAGLVMPAEPATVLALLAAVLVTGAFHEDGLADTADGLGAHVDRARKLEIMRDSRVGTYGALAVTFPLLLAFATLAPLDAGEFARAALCGHVLGRWSTLPQAALLPPARAAGAGSALSVGRAVLAAGTAYTAALVLVLAGAWPGAAALATAIALGALAGWGLARTLGGVTGDTFGAVNKVTEVATYAVLAAAWSG